MKIRLKHSGQIIDIGDKLDKVPIDVRMYEIIPDVNPDAPMALQLQGFYEKQRVSYPGESISSHPKSVHYRRDRYA